MFISERLRAAVFYTGGWGGQAPVGESEVRVCWSCVEGGSATALGRVTHQAHLLDSLSQKRSRWGCPPLTAGLVGATGAFAAPQSADASPTERVGPGLTWSWRSSHTRHSSNSRIQNSPHPLASASAERKGSLIKTNPPAPWPEQNRAPPPGARATGPLEWVALFICDIGSRKRHLQWCGKTRWMEVGAILRQNLQTGLCKEMQPFLVFQGLSYHGEKIKFIKEGKDLGN